MTVPLYLADAFADAPFSGNPAGVCLLDAPADPQWMQQVAMEMNQAETAFVVPGPSAWGLRWFTPGAEVELCGHATLASAHVLWETGRLKTSDPAQFDTLSGRLVCTRDGDCIVMDFPAIETREGGDLGGALECEVVWLGSNSMDLLAEVSSEETLRGLQPDMRALMNLKRGLIVTARSSKFDFVSRFFAPAVGVPEDPVTGSAHCALGPYWAARLGKPRLSAYQASKRGGRVGVEVLGDRVKLTGRAVTTLEGTLRC
jgi:predicted PhzF superfamily epimerase YddE/YHI9